MSSMLALEADELRDFSVPHTVRLVGEEQYVLGSGAICMAANIRLKIAVRRAAEGFELMAGGEGGEAAPEAQPTAAWQKALETEVLGGRGSLDGLRVTLDFGEIWGLCAHAGLMSSPAAAAALAVAAAGHRSKDLGASASQLAEGAARALCAATGAPNPDRFYADVLMSIAGGACYVEPGGERLNVQQLLPPASFTLAVAPGIPCRGDVYERDHDLREALMKVYRAGGDIASGGDAAFEALFGVAAEILEERQTTMIYGLLRVRQMIDSFLEHLGEPFVDNDQLAEMCDEESAILQDYFGFAAEPYRAICSRASESGALGVKFTWAFGGHPVAVIMAPGRRDTVNSALRKSFPDARFMPIQIEVAGLLRSGDTSVM